MVKGWLLSLSLVAIWEIVQIAVFHRVRPRLMFKAMTLLFLPTIPAFLLLYLYTPPDLFVLPAKIGSTPFFAGLLSGLIVHVLMYCTHVECFFHFDRSIQLRILCEFEKAEGRFLTVAQMRGVYGLEQAVKGRLDALVGNAYVREGEGRYVLTQKGRLFARAFDLCRWAFKVKA